MIIIMFFSAIFIQLQYFFPGVSTLPSTSQANTFTGNTSLCCETCGKQFTKKYYYEKHIASHPGPRSFACRFCNKLFTENRECKLHEYTHHGADVESYLELDVKAQEQGMAFVC